MGFGAVSIGPEAVKWSKIGQIVASWLTSPLLSGVLAFAIFNLTRSLVLDRDDPAPLSFAHGAHYCVGAALARMETRVGLRAIVERMGDYSIDEDDLDWNQSLLLRAHRALEGS